MNDPLDYDISEQIIKEGAILADFKTSNYHKPIKNLIESEIRSCFRAFLSKTDMKMDKNGEMVESVLSQEDLNAYRARAMGALSILEMIDGKINDMQVWVAKQQEESEKDVERTQELFSHHRSRMEAEIT